MPLLILVADDDPVIRAAVTDYLEMSGYSVISAENGAKALELLETYHPHLLVSDIKMPEKDGYTLVREIRQRPEFRLLPVVFLTEKSNTEERILGYEAGCDAYLAKPFEIAELIAVIRNLLERSQIVQSEFLFSQQQAHSEQIAKRKTKTNNSTQQLSLNLTEREQQVLVLLAQGFSNGEIGNHLYLSPRTIEKYVSSLLKKTATSNRAELVRFALDRNLV